MLRDAHATGEGYLRSPRDGSLQDIVERILTLERDAGVCPDRRLGVSLGFHLFARQAGDAAAWGGEWIETRPSGPQGWWPADACTGALFGHLRHIGLAWRASAPAPVNTWRGSSLRRATKVWASPCDPPPTPWRSSRTPTPVG